MRILSTDLGAPHGVVAFSTCRDGGVAPCGAYAGFNACHYTGDSVAHVSECRDALCLELGIGRERLVIPRQTHSDRVAVIDRVPVADGDLDGIDALVTALPRVALCINTADCVPLMLADAQAGVVAAVHAGWRGVLSAIVARTVEAMVCLGADAGRIEAMMGPCICGHCFEVGPEVAQLFSAAYPGAAGVVLDGYAKPHVDLAEALVLTLRELGVTSVRRPPACTHCCPDTYFSARRLGVDSGRMLTVIMAGEEAFGEMRR